MSYALGTLFLVLRVMLLVGLTIMFQPFLFVVYSLIADTPMPEYFFGPESSRNVTMIAYVALCAICIGCGRMSEKLMSAPNKPNDAADNQNFSTKK
ncbi:MAG: hypothetical protein PSY14_08285 [bacterium]|nr:hypothetical protein [bacterium]